MLSRSLHHHTLRCTYRQVHWAPRHSLKQEDLTPSQDAIQLCSFHLHQQVRQLSEFMWVFVKFGKFSSLEKRVCSMASGEPYVSSSLFYIIIKPLDGSLILTAFILRARLFPKPLDEHVACQLFSW